jgi:tetratricopeptide (TPR) repeat protein
MKNLKLTFFRKMRGCGSRQTVLAVLCCCCLSQRAAPGAEATVPTPSSTNHIAVSDTKGEKAAAFLARAKEALDQRSWDTAISNLTEAIHLDPLLISAYEARGPAYMATGNWTNALQDLNEVIRVQPTNAGALLNRANARGQLRDFVGALSDLKECLLLQPAFGAAYYSRARIYFNSGNFAEAVTNCNESLRVGAQEVRSVTIRLRGHAYGALGEFDKAASDFEEAVRLEPDNADAHNALAWLRATSPVANERNGKQAVLEAVRACELSKWSSWEIIDTLATAHAEVGDFKKAMACERQALQMVTNKEDEKELYDRLLLFEDHKPFRAPEVK